MTKEFATKNIRKSTMFSKSTKKPMFLDFVIFMAVNFKNL